MSISLPILTGNASLSNCWILRTPDRPSRMDSHSVAVSAPRDVITPIPVMTTRRSRARRTFATSSVATYLHSLSFWPDDAVQVLRLGRGNQFRGLVERQRELGGGDHLVAPVRLALDPCLVPLAGDDLDLQPELVAGEHEVAEAEALEGADQP